MSTLTAMPASAASRLGLVTWRYPEWWVLAICAAAWGTMIGGMGHGHVQAGSAAVLLQFSAWMAMTVAMMLPAVVPQMRWVAVGSFWHRRHWAIAGFAVGYLLAWCAAGSIAAVLLLPRWARHPAVPVVLFLGAAVWQRTTWYRYARRLCHRTIPLAPLGWRADRDCVRYGALVGTGCVRACFPLMLACAATGHGLIAMAGGCWLALCENWWPLPRPRILLAGTLGLALFYALLWAAGAGTVHTSMRM